MSCFSVQILQPPEKIVDVSGNSSIHTTIELSQCIVQAPSDFNERVLVAVSGNIVASTGISINTSGNKLYVNSLLNAGSGIGIVHNSGVYTISTTGNFVLTQEEVDDRISSLLIGGSNIFLDYNDNSNSLTISTSGLQPSGNYSFVGHSHTSLDITDFVGSVSGLLPNSFDAAVDWTPYHTIIDGTRYLIGDLVHQSGRLYRANYENESIPVTNSLYWTDVGQGYRLNIDGRDISNIPYPVTTVNGQVGNVTISGLNIFNQDLNTYNRPIFSGITCSGILKTETFIVTDLQNRNVVAIDPQDLYLFADNFKIDFAGSNGYIKFSDGTIQNTAYSGIDIIGGTGISVQNTSGNYTINSTGSGVIADQSSALVTTVFNKTGSPIPKMTAVYINGGQGDMPTVTLGLATSDSTSAGTYGLTYETIPNMSSGKVIVFGALNGLNTDQFNPTAPVGDVNGKVLYLSPTVPGLLTTTKPHATDHMVVIGTIIRTHQTQGIIEVRIQNGYELEELHNVAISGVTNGQFLQYNSDTELWIPSISGNFSSLSVNGTGVSVSGHSHTSSNITNFNSSVSGLLPVTNIIGGTGISINNSGAAYTIHQNNQIPLISSGTLIGSNPINAGVSNSIQQITLNGTAVTFTKGTGWPSTNDVSIDTILRITATSGTAITWSLVSDWFNQPPAGALSSGTHLFLLRGIGSSIIEGHYIGSKTN